MPQACMSAYIVVGPTNAKPRRLSSLASAWTPASAPAARTSRPVGEPGPGGAPRSAARGRRRRGARPSPGVDDRRLDLPRSRTMPASCMSRATSSSPNAATASGRSSRTRRGPWALRRIRHPRRPDWNPSRTTSRRACARRRLPGPTRRRGNRCAAGPTSASSGPPRPSRRMRPSRGPGAGLREHEADVLAHHLELRDVLARRGRGRRPRAAAPAPPARWRPTRCRRPACRPATPRRTCASLSIRCDSAPCSRATSTRRLRVRRVARADHEHELALRRHLLHRRLAVGRRVADVVGAGTDDAREALAQAGDDRARLVDRERRLRDVGELRRGPRPRARRRRPRTPRARCARAPPPSCPRPPRGRRGR